MSEKKKFLIATCVTILGATLLSAVFIWDTGNTVVAIPIFVCSVAGGFAAYFAQRGVP